jgi:hypothetical protein
LLGWCVRGHEIEFWLSKMFTAWTWTCFKIIPTAPHSLIILSSTSCSLETKSFVKYNFRLPEYRFHVCSGSVVGWGTILKAGRSRVRFPVRSLDFSNYLILAAALRLWVVSACNRHEYQESFGGKGRPARKADNLTVIKKMWEPRRLTLVWASTACCKDSFSLFILTSIKLISRVKLGVTTGRVPINFAYLLPIPPLWFIRNVIHYHPN